MRIKARKIGRCALPPIGAYTMHKSFQGDFESIQIKDPVTFKLPIRIRPKGVRQSQAEAVVLGNIRTIAQGRAGFSDVDVRNGAYK